MKFVYVFHQQPKPFLVCVTVPPALYQPSIELFHQSTQYTRMNVNEDNVFMMQLNMILPVAKMSVLKRLVYNILEFSADQNGNVNQDQCSIAVVSIWFHQNHRRNHQRESH